MASCNDKPYIKIGDSFDVPLELIDTDTQLAVDLLPNMEFSCTIIDVAGSVIATPTITPHPDQVNFKGYLTAVVPVSVTSTWKVGKAKFDIKVAIDDSVKHTKDFQFDIVGSITQ